MSIGSKIAAFFTQKKIDEQTLQMLEDTLISSDIGVAKTNELIAKIKNLKWGKEISLEELKSFLKAELSIPLENAEKKLDFEQKKPMVILFAGVNGSGKTTTIGKIAYQLSLMNKKIMLVAGDTFRAAATEQLEVWAKRSGAFLAKREKAEPSGLIFDALKKANEENFDIVLIDTAGRLQNKEGLMAELEKIIRVAAKIIPDAPYEKILVLDATVGQNAHSQVKEFDKVLSLTGLIITKMDGTAKAGAIIPLAENYNLPIYYIGNGEKPDDLIPFKTKEFLQKLIA